MQRRKSNINDKINIATIKRERRFSLLFFIEMRFKNELEKQYRKIKLKRVKKILKNYWNFWANEL